MTLHQSTAFSFAGMDAGLGLYTGVYEIRPALLVNDLQARMKLAAKLLSRAAGVPRTHAYELLAHAGGFSHWHHLSAHLGGAASPPVTAQWLDAFIPLLPVISIVLPDSPPEAACRQGLEAFWGRVAAEAGVSRDVILDQVGARLLGERTWHALLARSPLDSTAPLYTFVTRGDGSSVFSWSRGCATLVDDLDRQWQGYERFPDDAKQRAKTWVTSTLASRPEFLEAGLALAWMQRADEPAQAKKTLKDHLDRTAALIPKGFRGTIPGYEHENRFYLRMLHLQMAMYLEDDDLRRATLTAKKLLRLDPDDLLYVRDCLPLLLLGQGDVDGAAQGCDRFAELPHYQWAAIRAFVLYAAGRHAEFRTELLTALFTWPALRAFLEDADTLAVDESGTRGVCVDYEYFAAYAWPAYNAVRGLRAAALRTIRDKAVVAAETELRMLWNGYRRIREGEPATHTWEEWDAGWRRYAAQL